MFYPFDVTVKFKLIPAQEPTGPQSVGGLSGSQREILFECETGRTCTGLLPG